MTGTTPTRSDQLVAQLTVLCEEFGRELLPSVLKRTARTLAEYAPQDLHAALTRCVEEGGWTRDQTLTSFVLAKLVGDMEQAVALSWARLTDHTSDEGPVILSDPAAQAAAKDLGGRCEVARMDAYARDRARREYGTLYRAHATEGRSTVSAYTVATGTHNGRCLTAAMRRRQLPPPQPMAALHDPGDGPADPQAVVAILEESGREHHAREAERLRQADAERARLCGGPSTTEENAEGGRDGRQD